MTQDVLDRLRTYRPTNESITSEWSNAERTAVREAIFDDAGPQLVRFRSARPRRLRILAPLTASAAVVAVVAGVLALRSGGSDPALAGGHATHYSHQALSANDGVGANQYVHRVDRAVVVGADGKPRGEEQRSDIYVAPNGDVIYVDAASPTGCTWYVHSGTTTFANATAAFIDSLPTDATLLRTYMLDHVHGSSSKDEAVFVAVGDMLRLFDGLAPPRLRASLVDVLSTSHLVTIHAADTDYLGRPAIRVDFMDQTRRPGELASLYFDPSTFQLLEERNGLNGLSDEPNPGASFPYSATPTVSGGTSLQLTGRANVDVAVSETVVDHLPVDTAKCTRVED